MEQYYFASLARKAAPKPLRGRHDARAGRASASVRAAGSKPARSCWPWRLSDVESTWQFSPFTPLCGQCSYCARISRPLFNSPLWPASQLSARQFPRTRPCRPLAALAALWPAEKRFPELPLSLHPPTRSPRQPQPRPRSREPLALACTATVLPPPFCGVHVNTQTLLLLF